MTTTKLPDRAIAEAVVKPIAEGLTGIAIEQIEIDDAVKVLTELLATERAAAKELVKGCQAALLDCLDTLKARQRYLPTEGTAERIEATQDCLRDVTEWRKIYDC